MRGDERKRTVRVKAYVRRVEDGGSGECWGTGGGGWERGLSMWSSRTILCDVCWELSYRE
jgi:hypothetical protein